MQLNKFVINSNLYFRDNYRVKLLYYGVTYTLPEALYDYIYEHQNNELLTEDELLVIVDEGTLELLVARFIIFKQETFDYLQYGVFDYTKAITRDFNILGAVRLPEYCLIGLPIDSNNFGSYSCKYSPDGIRLALKELLTKEDNYIDCGDIQCFNHFEAVSIISKRLRYAMDAVVRNHSKPLFLGGDHSLTYYTVRSLVEMYSNENIVLIQFDAHNDLSKSSIENFDHLTNANFIRKLIEIEPNIQKVIQFGVRDNIPIENEKIWQLETAEIAKAIEYVEINNLKCYLTIDLDCLDPVLAPEVNYPIEMGLQVAELKQSLMELNQRCEVIGIDFMEVSKGRKKSNKTAQISAELIQSIIG